MVPSSIRSRSSAAPLPARAANTASNTPRSRQRAKRRQTVFHFPYRSGMVRQRAPSRARHRMPSSIRRLSRLGWPGHPCFRARNGPTSSHSASMRSPAAIPPDLGAIRPHGLELGDGKITRLSTVAAWQPSAGADIGLLLLSCKWENMCIEQLAAAEEQQAARAPYALRGRQAPAVLSYRISGRAPWGWRFAAGGGMERETVPMIMGRSRRPS